MVESLGRSVVPLVVCRNAGICDLGPLGGKVGLRLQSPFGSNLLRRLSGHRRLGLTTIVISHQPTERVVNPCPTHAAPKTEYLLVGVNEPDFDHHSDILRVLFPFGARPGPSIATIGRRGRRRRRRRVKVLHRLRSLPSRLLGLTGLSFLDLRRSRRGQCCQHRLSLGDGTRDGSGYTPQESSNLRRLDRHAGQLLFHTTDFRSLLVPLLGLCSHLSLQGIFTGIGQGRCRTWSAPHSFGSSRNDPKGSSTSDKLESLLEPRVLRLVVIDLVVLLRGGLHSLQHHLQRLANGWILDGLATSRARS